MSWWQIDDPTPDRLIAVLGEAVMAHAQGIFERDPSLQTILMAVAQYWADNASDEVHCELLFSIDDATPWPHACAHSGGTDPFECELCRGWGSTERTPREDFWLPGAAAFKRAIEAFCLEGASQYMQTSETSLPFFILRRGATEAELVGQLQRPWLRPDLVHVEPPPPDLVPLFAEVYRRPGADEPRLVLADCLQAEGDPRGTFMAFQLHPDPTPAMQAEMARLLAAHRGAWLGALLPVVSPARCRFTRGFASAVALGPAPPEAFEALADAPAWATVDTLAFPELDEPPTWTLLPRFRQVRRIEAPEDVLEEMADAGGDWAMEALHCTGAGGIDAVLRLNLPAIRRLLVENPRPDDLRRLATLPWWARLTRLDLVTPDPVAHFAAAVRLTSSSVQALSDSGWLVIRRTDERAARIHLHSYAAHRFAAAGDALRAALPAGWRVEVEPGLPDEARFALLQALSTIGFE